MGVNILQIRIVVMKELHTLISKFSLINQFKTNAKSTSFHLFIKKNKIMKD